MRMASGTTVARFQAHPHFQVEVVQLAGPPLALSLKLGLRIQVEIRTDEVHRALVPVMPPGNMDADSSRHVLQFAREGANQIGACLAQSGHRDTGVPLVPKGSS